MLDFNHRPTMSESIISLIDNGLSKRQSEQTPRNYLGGSRLGVECDRALQYEYLNVPFDDGRDFSGRTLRIFEAGHVFENLAINWLRLAGFTLLTEKENGEQFGFSTFDGKIKGHIDGVVSDGPVDLQLNYPMLWECKSLNNKSWNQLVKHKVAKSHPVYSAQMSIYQAYMTPVFPDLYKTPALFTAINKDTAVVHFELKAFDGELAQKCSDRGIKIIEACEAHELLPRVTNDPTYYKCKWCSWQDRCWGTND